MVSGRHIGSKMTRESFERTTIGGGVKSVKVTHDRGRINATLYKYSIEKIESPARTWPQHISSHQLTPRLIRVTRSREIIVCRLFLYWAAWQTNLKGDLSSKVL